MRNCVSKICCTIVDGMNRPPGTATSRHCHVAGWGKEGGGRGERGADGGLGCSMQDSVPETCHTMIDGMNRPPGTATPLARAISIR